LGLLQDVYIRYTLFLSLRDGGSNAAKSRNPISKGTD